MRVPRVLHVGLLTAGSLSFARCRSPQRRPRVRYLLIRSAQIERSCRIQWYGRPGLVVHTTVFDNSAQSEPTGSTGISLAGVAAVIDNVQMTSFPRSGDQRGGHAVRAFASALRMNESQVSNAAGAPAALLTWLSFIRKALANARTACPPRWSPDRGKLVICTLSITAATPASEIPVDPVGSD